VEQFNRTFRDELLDQCLFTTLDEVREATYWRMREYNEYRPHTSLADMTPRQFAAEHSEAGFF
jgi:putative transposase